MLSPRGGMLVPPAHHTPEGSTWHLVLLIVSNPTHCVNLQLFKLPNPSNGKPMREFENKRVAVG